MQVLTNHTVIITLQYICTLNYQVVYIKLTQCYYMWIILIKPEKSKKINKINVETFEPSLKEGLSYMEYYTADSPLSSLAYISLKCYFGL